MSMTQREALEALLETHEPGDIDDEMIEGMMQL